MYKRFWLVLLVVLGLSLSAAAATKLEVVTFDENLAKWYNTEGAKFSKMYPDITVEARVIAGWVDGINNHITVRIAAGDPPDIADTVLRLYYPWADQGLLLDMTALLQRSQIVNLRHMIPGLANTKAYKGKLYNAPTSVDPFLTVFDGQMFAEAGIMDPYEMSQARTWSWDSGLDAAKKLLRTAADGKVTQWGWQAAGNTDWTWGSFIVVNKGRMLSPDLRRVAFTEEPAIEALSYLADMYTQHGVGTRAAAFHTHPIAMATGNTAHLKQHWDANKREGLSAAPIPPRYAGGQSGGYMFADGPIIFNKGKNAEAAWKFVEYLMTEGPQKSLVDITGRIPARLDALNYWAQLAAPYIGGKERAHLISDAAANARLMALGVHYNDMMAVVNPAVQQILDGKAPVRATMEEAGRKVQLILDKYYGGK